MEAQIKRGLLDICGLATQRTTESYGYKKLKDVSEIIPISESTLYPILKRLESNNCVTTHSVEYNGRLRKYYKITNVGLEKIQEFLKDWQIISNAHKYILGDENYE